MTKLRSKQVLTDEEVKIFIDKECKLLTSKQLAEVLNVSDGALRKQRSKGKSIFPYANINGRIFKKKTLLLTNILMKQN